MDQIQDLAQRMLDVLVESGHEFNASFQERNDWVNCQMVLNEHPPVISDLGTHYTLDGRMLYPATYEADEIGDGMIMARGQKLSKVVRVASVDTVTAGPGVPETTIHFETVQD